jgi:hypothetical protein
MKNRQRRTDNSESEIQGFFPFDFAQGQDDDKEQNSTKLSTTVFEQVLRMTAYSNNNDAESTFFDDYLRDITLMSRL